MVIKETAYDYDNCIYFVSKEIGSDLVKFSFKCNFSNDILKNGGEDMLDALFKGMSKTDINKLNRVFIAQISINF
jgi:hypothetical protein